MKTIQCITPVNFSDGFEMLVLPVLDLGDRYRVVFRWGDSLEFPDQGPIPGLYVDHPKQFFQEGPEEDGQPTLVLNSPIDLASTRAEIMDEL